MYKVLHVAMITLLDICVDISYLHLTRNKVVFYQLNTDQVKADRDILPEHTLY